MIQTLPREINPFQFARDNRRISGQLGVCSRNRLRELLTDHTGDIEVDLEFSQLPDKIATVSGSLRVSLFLQCQRCLEPFKLDLDISVNSQLSPNKISTNIVSKESEAIVIIDDIFYFHDFIEDEVLLAIPFAPKHPFGQCSRSTITNPVPDPVSVDKKKKPNPFEILKKLKK